MNEYPIRSLNVVSNAKTISMRINQELYDSIRNLIPRQSFSAFVNKLLYDWLRSQSENTEQPESIESSA